MSSKTSTDIDIHYVNIFLKNKGMGSLALIQTLINELNKKKANWEREISDLNEKEKRLKLNVQKTEDSFRILIKEHEQKASQKESELLNTIKSTQEILANIQTDINKKVPDNQIEQIKSQFIKQKESFNSIQAIHKSMFENLLQKQTLFSKQVSQELLAIQNDSNAFKQQIQNAKDILIRLENLHRATAKNPKTLFNDNCQHDLTLFAAKDPSFKEALNNFLIKFLEQKDFLLICEKVGKLLSEVYQKSKNFSFSDLQHIYMNMLQTIIDEGASRLDKPIEIIIVDPEMEKSLRQFQHDINLFEMLQIARLSTSIQKKVMSSPIMVIYFIQLLRLNLKESEKEKLVIKNADWESLIYLRSKWPIFFNKFNFELTSFNEPFTIRTFHQTIQNATEMLKNPISEQIFQKILFLREHNKETFRSGLTVIELVNLLYNTILMTKTLHLRNVHHVEVMRLFEEIDPLHKNSFLELFEENDVARMLSISQNKSISYDEQTNVYLRVKPIYENLEKVAELFGVKQYNELPSQIILLLKSLYIDKADHLKQVESIIENMASFEKNIQLSVVASDKQLPLANAILNSLIKCCEYTSACEALEEMIISKELNKALSRRANLKNN